MATSLLWLPDGAQTGQHKPAIIFLHRWGGYPHDPIARLLGPALANRGYVCLSLCLRRRGMEGQLTAIPDNDLRDVQVGVDFLHTQGCEDIFLAGEEIGALSALRYQAKYKDMRVKGCALLYPVDDPHLLLSQTAGASAYNDALRNASVAARQGSGMDFRIDLFPEHAPDVTQHASAFLSWWSPAADTRWENVVANAPTPLLLAAISKQNIPDSLQRQIDAERGIEYVYESPTGLAEKIDAWATSLGARKLVPVKTELVEIDSAGHSLYGFIWQPEQQQTEVAVLLMHGLTSSPSSPLFGKMGPILAQRDCTVLAIESHRSGWSGHETALLEQDTIDIDNWVSFLIARGYKKIVLAGASMGSLSIGRYQAVNQNPAVAGLAHLMPTADGPAWFKQAAGSGPYEQAVKMANDAVASGQGNSFLIDIDIRQPAPSLSHGRFRWTQRAASWLSWWGPQADSVNTKHIAAAKVPVLLLSGTADSYNDPARFAELKAAAINAPSVAEIWYEDIDHGLAGVERKVADDIHAWLNKLGMFE